MIRLLVALGLTLGVITNSFAFSSEVPPKVTGGCSAVQPMPLDAGVSGITAAYGTCSLGKAWLQRPLFDVISGGQTYTIRAINGIPDTRLMAQLMGIQPQFGRGGLPVSRWYDQSGNGNDCTQAAAAHQLSAWLINGTVAIHSDGYIQTRAIGSTVIQFCALPSGVAANSNATTEYFAGTQYQMGAPANPTAAVSGGILSLLGSGCCGGGAGSGFQVSGQSQAANDPANFFSFSWDGFTGVTNPQLWPESEPSVIGMIAGASTVTWTQNEETATVSSSALVFNTTTGGSLGGDASNTDEGSVYAALQGILIFGSSALSSGNQQTIRNSLYGRFGIAKTQSYSVIIDGASYDIGWGSLVGGLNGNGWAQQLASLFPYPVRYTNLAVNGATIANLTTAWNGLSAYPCAGTYTKTILIGPASAAGNSISGGETGAQAYFDLQSYLIAVKAHCTWSAILVTTTPGTGEYANYSSLIRLNAAALGVTVVDWAADPVLTAQGGTNQNFYNQSAEYTGHYVPAAYGILASDYAAVLRSAIGQ